MRQVRRLHRLVARQEKALALQQEYLTLLERLTSPPLLVTVGAAEPALPPEEVLPTELLLPPPLTEAEIRELQELPMPDPLVEIEARLGLSTSPRSPQTYLG